ncbi:hypothetical protein [Nonomuraea sp. NPDC050786]|uniref:hypothetical protein n=1 Tax=Nonomuraea sp. NPDC050786 TaxID=3154840 RepID=UPI0033DAE279
MIGRARSSALLSAGVVAGLLVGSGGVAAVAAAVEDGEIVACADKDNVLRLAPTPSPSPSPSAICGEGEKTVAWNAVGPQGPAGPPGPGAEAYDAWGDSVEYPITEHDITRKTIAVLNNLPVGSYVVNADLQVKQRLGDPVPFDVDCLVTTLPDVPLGVPGPYAELAAGQQWNGAFTRTLTFKSPGSVYLKCYVRGSSVGTGDATAMFYRQHLTATTVTKVNGR